MSRANKSVEPKRTTTQVDRRDVAATRVHFEALVEVGAGPSGGFEAESVDVSPDGMRLRTAYLPELGERLVCRFDGFGGEVVAEGEVTWRRDQGRGGEFGIRFIDLDSHGAKLLHEMCPPPVSDDADAAAEADSAFVGSRVKLHIEGLGSPMRARVKDSARGEILVGSSLEFLRVGRGIELEDVEKGGRRTALIEHVGVEIDRMNNIPQLVVALRYEDAEPMDAGDKAPSAERPPARARVARGTEAVAKERTPEPSVIDNDEMAADDFSQDQPPTLATPRHRPALEAKAPVARAVTVETAAGTLGALAKTVGPKLASASSSARKVLGSLLETVKKKRDERVAGPSSKVKRTTAPPPSGALMSDGRRLFRQTRTVEPEAEGFGADVPPTNAKRKAIVASVLGVLAVLAVYVFATHASGKTAGDPTAVAAALSSAPQNDVAAAEAPVPGGGVATANVPLFGATPLSTTEPVPTPPNLEALAAAAEPGDAPPGEAPAAGSPEEPGAEAAGPAPSSNTALRKDWGIGQVHDPVSLKLTMDGDVTGFTGSEGATGFTLVVPGRKSVSSASGLARKDKRIESLNVINYPDRAEITVHFKGEVPSYAVKASGNRVSIDIDGGKGDHADDAASSKKKGKNAVKSSPREKSKGADKGKKHDSKNAKLASESPKSDKKSDAKKADKKSDGKKPKK